MDKISFTELSDILSKEAGLSKQAAHDIFTNLSAAIQEGLLRDGHVRIKGLGSFKRRKVADRRGINPRTGELIEIPEHYKIVFNPDKKIKETLNINSPAHNKAQTVVGSSPLSPNLKKTGRFNKYIVGGAAAALLVFLVYVVWPGGNESTPPIAIEAVLTEVADFTETVVAETTTIVEQIELKELEPAAEIDETEQEIEIATTTAETEEAYSKYVIDKGDNLWVIAEKQYGNPYLWPLIYMANKSKIKNPDILLTGSEIQVPELMGTNEDTEKLALGNAHVYKVYHENEVAGALDYLTVAHTLDSGISEKVEFNETAKEILMSLARN